MSRKEDVRADVLVIEAESEQIPAASEDSSPTRGLDPAFRSAEASVVAKLEAIFAEKLNMTVPSVTADLFATGILDSLGLVRLLACLEEQFEILVPIEDLDLESFRTLSSIADLIVRNETEWRRPGGGPVSVAAASEVEPKNG